MAIFKRAAPAAERSSEEETERVHYELRQCLRATGTARLFRELARDEGFYCALWASLRPNVETRAFEDAADKLRAEAVDAADAMGRLSALSRAQLGESQAYQVQAALSLYLYLDAKLLVFAACLAQALEAGERGLSRPEGPRGSADLIERGAPRKMAMMELVEDKPGDDSVRKVFRDVKRVYGLSAVDDDYRTLALWPRYLAAAWERIKPTARTEGYRIAGSRLRDLARQLALELPYPVEPPPEPEAARRALETARAFERALPSLMLNVALMALDWQAPELLRRSPFPAGPRAGAEAL